MSSRATVCHDLLLCAITFYCVSGLVIVCHQVLTELQQAIRKQTADAEQNLHEIKLEAERHLASVRHSELELSEHYGDIKDIKSVVSN